MKKESLKNNFFLVLKNPSITISMLSHRTYSTIPKALEILLEKLILVMKIKFNGKKIMFPVLKEEI